MKLPRLNSIRQAWPREKIIAHWQALLAKPTDFPIVHRFAEEALAALRAQTKEPGEDG